MASLLDIYNHVSAQGDKGREEGKKRGLESLMGQAYSAPREQRQGYLSQMAATSPEYAFNAQKQFAESDNSYREQLGKQAQLFVSAPEQSRPQMYPSLVHSARQAGLSIPDGDYDPKYLEGITSVANKFGTSSTAVQSTKIGADGYYWTVDRNGNWSNSGIKANPNIRILEQEGQVPFGVVTSGGVVGSTVPVGGGMAGSGNTGASVAIDGLPPDQQQRMAHTVSLMRQAGYSDKDMDAWMQSQLSQPRTAPAQTAPAPTAPAPVRTPTAAEKAAAAEQAKLDVQLRYAPAVAAADADRAGRVKAAESRVEQADKARSNTTALSMYEEAIAGLEDGLSKTVTGPIAGRVPEFTSGQQIAEGGVAAMTPILKQIFRTAGEGTFTDRDQELLLKMVPTRMDHPEARKAKIANIDRIVRAKLGVKQAPRQPGAATQTPSGWSIQRVE